MQTLLFSVPSPWNTCSQCDQLPVCPWLWLQFDHRSTLWRGGKTNDWIWWVYLVRGIFCNGPLRWRHNDHDSVLNHQPHDCLLNRLFRRRSKKTSRLCVTGHCAGNSPGPVNSPHKWPVTRKMFPFDDVIMRKLTITTMGAFLYRIPFKAIASKGYIGTSFAISFHFQGWYTHTHTHTYI